MRLRELEVQKRRRNTYQLNINEILRIINVLLQLKEENRYKCNISNIQEEEKTLLDNNVVDYTEVNLFRVLSMRTK